MPLIKLETNQQIPAEKTPALLRDLAAVAGLAGTPQAETRAELAHGHRMRLAGDDQKVHVEIRGLDYPKDRAAELAAEVGGVVERHLGVDRAGVYIAVISNRHSMWRVDGGAARG